MKCKAPLAQDVLATTAVLLHEGTAWRDHCFRLSEDLFHSRGSQILQVYIVFISLFLVSLPNNFEATECLI